MTLEDGHGGEALAPRRGELSRSHAHSQGLAPVVFGDHPRVRGLGDERELIPPLLGWSQNQCSGPSPSSHA